MSGVPLYVAVQPHAGLQTQQLPANESYFTVTSMAQLCGIFRGKISKVIEGGARRCPSSLLSLNILECPW